MHLWMNSVKPMVRVGTYHAKGAREICGLLDKPTHWIDRVDHDGKFAVEVPLVRGVKRRLMIEKKVGTLDLKGTQSVGHAILRQLSKPDSNPLARES